MRWSSVHACAITLAVVAASAVFSASLPPADPQAPAEAPKRLSVYTPGASFAVAATDRNGQPYADAVDVLGPLGQLEIQDQGKKWKARFTPAEALHPAKPGEAVEVRFEDGKNKARVRGRDVPLAAPVAVENGRPQLPITSLPAVFAAMLNTRISLHESARRLFLGEVGTRFTAEVKPAPESLVLNFSAPVNPTVHTEPGKLRMTFVREPLITMNDRLTFDSKTIPLVTYGEANGAAELTVNSTTPLLASFSNGGRTITLTLAPTPAQAAARENAGTPAASVAAPPATPEKPAATPVPSPGHARFLVLIDPAHGGEERGAVLSETILEKDLALSLARRLKTELAARGIAASLLRDQDITVSLDQRAQAANAVRPWLYLALHVTASGAGVRLYTPLLPAAAAAAPAGLVPWERAQQGALANSRSLGEALLARLQQHQVAATLTSAPLRPLNNITAAALAIEVTPPSGPKPLERLASSGFQQQIAAALAVALAEVQKELEPAAVERRGVAPPGATP